MTPLCGVLPSLRLLFLSLGTCRDWRGSTPQRRGHVRRSSQSAEALAKADSEGGGNDDE